jgi:acyl-CoA thioesterase II
VTEVAGEASLADLLAVFDVQPVDAGSTEYVGSSESRGRNVVEGSQLLGQAMVAASKALPGRTVRSAHGLFAGAVSPASPIEFTVAPVRAGRSFASAVVTIGQGGRACATATVLLDRAEADVIRHDRPGHACAYGSVGGHGSAGLPVGGPESAYPAAVNPVPFRDLRIEGVRDHNSPDEVGPPILDAWLRYDALPDRDDLRRALLAHYTGDLSIATAMRAHAGIGTALAHQTVSTAVMTIGVTFHDPVEWDGWLRYHHESTFAGAGMAYARGQVLTEDGRIIASFTQDSMIRAFAPNTSSTAMAAESRL